MYAARDDRTAVPWNVSIRAIGECVIASVYESSADKFVGKIVKVTDGVK